MKSRRQRTHATLRDRAWDCAYEMGFFGRLRGDQLAFVASMLVLFVEAERARAEKPEAAS